MKKFLPLIILFPVLISSAQNLDSLYNKFLHIRNATQFISGQQFVVNEGPIKCGFETVNQVWLNYEKFLPKQKEELKSLLDRPITDTSFVTPSGNFRIHFSKSGSDAPGYDIRELAKAADSAYNYEVNILGFSSPPNDAGRGGDNRYDIYVLNLSSGEYGYTQFDSLLTNDRYACFTVIDNDFGSGYNTHGIDGARVTVAHEFHHAIQVGDYIYRADDNYYYELTSTSMEKFVYSSLNDYISYMDSYFRNPQRAFASNDGYNIAIWHLFLRDRFGIGIIKNIWELMPQKRALQCIADAIQSAGSTFKVEFNQFGVWTYYTGIRALPNKYFKDAALYQSLIVPTVITNSITVNSEAVSNNFFQLNDFSTGKKDSIVTVVSNSDIAGGISSPSATLNFTYSLSTQPISGGNKITDRYYSKLEPNNILLIESNVLTGLISLSQLDYAFPQPFKYSLYNLINFPVASNGETTAQLYIYSVDMNLVYSGLFNIVGNEIISWNCLDNNGKKLGTGVYIFVTKTGDAIKKGKFVIHND